MAAPERVLFVHGDGYRSRGVAHDGDEVVTDTAPALIESHLFERVQRQLHARSPKVAAPRVTTGPIPRTRLAVCATCNDSMTLRTGKR
jgi:site-specific DNA recombinase